MAERRLDGRIAVITGASAGIGQAIAQALVREGARVVINARREERLSAVWRTLGGNDRAVCVPGDAADPHIIAAMLDAARDRFGAGVREADLVIVNAGRGLRGGVHDSDAAQWEEMIRTNLTGAAALMREAARRMGREGTPPADWLRRPRDIVVLGSTVGRHVSPFSSMYGATKAAVHMLAESLRRAMAPHGVRVSLIEPGVVRSEFQSVAGYDPESFGRFMDSIAPVLTPEDVARLVIFITSQPPAVHICDAVVRPTRQEYP